ncbi:hypothetical protein TNCV_112951 [Trichonephila clavipes]|nr:hypothetical protein TNCV_112951 [Trichonephila clavipes]
MGNKSWENLNGVRKLWAYNSALQSSAEDRGVVFHTTVATALCNYPTRPFRSSFVAQSRWLGDGARGFRVIVNCMALDPR